MDLSIHSNGDQDTTNMMDFASHAALQDDSSRTPLPTSRNLLEFKTMHRGGTISSFDMMATNDAPEADDLKKRSARKSTGSKTVTTNGNSNASSPTGSKNPSSFPRKLYEMLEDAEVHGFTHIISWLPCGTGLKVHSQREFEVSGIMSRYFKQTRYKSFQKQLNLYKFQRTLDGPNKGSYSHQLFCRGRFDLCRQITRPAAGPGGGKTGEKEGQDDLPVLPSTTHQHSNPEQQQQQQQQNGNHPPSSSNDFQPLHDGEPEDLLEELANEFFYSKAHGSPSTTTDTPPRTLAQRWDSVHDSPSSMHVGGTGAIALMVNQTPEKVIDEIISTFGSKR